MDTARSPAERLLLTLASLVIVIAGMRAAAPILVPFLLSLFIAIVCAPAMAWLRAHRLPTGLALAVVILGVVAFGGLVGLLIGSSVQDFTQALPGYQTRLHDKAVELIGWLQGLGIDVSKAGLLEYLDPGAAMRLVGDMLAGMSGVLTNAFLILLTVIFILFEAAGFADKLRAAFADPQTTLPHLEDFTGKIQRYMAIKTWVSLATGALIALWLALLGVDYPLLWGMLAFLLNYVPNIGSILAAVPAVLLALIQLGLGPALAAGAGYLAVNLVMGNLVEPRFLGKGLGLSTLVVFLSLVFWGWVLGPVGMILSVPLTIAVKIALDSNQQTRGIALLLG